MGKKLFYFTTPYVKDFRVIIDYDDNQVLLCFSDLSKLMHITKSDVKEEELGNIYQYQKIESTKEMIPFVDNKYFDSIIKYAKSVKKDDFIRDIKEFITDKTESFSKNSPFDMNSYDEKRNVVDELEKKHHEVIRLSDELHETKEYKKDFRALTESTDKWFRLPYVVNTLHIRGLDGNTVMKLLRDYCEIDENNKPQQSLIDKGFYRFTKSTLMIKDKTKISCLLWFTRKGIDRVKELYYKKNERTNNGQN
jgi:hypothetical protein